MTPPRPAGASYPAVLAVGFGIAVAMWAIGYVGRLPALLLPSPLLLAGMLACPIAGGVVLGRRGGSGWLVAAHAGALAGVLNLLILGSFLGEAGGGRVVPSAAVWLPGSVLLSAGLAGLGAAVGGTRASTAAPAAVDAWPNRLVWVAVAATLLLIGAGGLVTSAEAGLAVADWPTSFGYNMFLYPFSRMTGGIYFEHAHRLLGALVGLTAVTTALCLQATDRRRGVHAFAWVLVAAVAVQGLLGGLRVTERNLALAMLHGVLAQLYLAGLVALGAVTAPDWRERAAHASPRGGRGDLRTVETLLVAALAAQLVLGAAQRHFQGLLWVHVVFGLGVVAPFGVHVGMRAWGSNPDEPRLRKLGLGLVGVLGVQVLLGLGAWAATVLAAGGPPRALDLTLATLHQWFGAVVLGTAVLLGSWSFRGRRDAVA